MNGLDFLVIIIILAFIARGLSRGLIKEVFTTIGLFVGLYIAVLETGKLTYYLTPYIPSKFFAYLLTFFVLFFVVYLIIMVVGDAIAKLVRLLMLGFFDKALGGVLGFVEGFFIAGALMFIVYRYFPGGAGAVESGKIAAPVYHRFWSLFGKTWNMQEEKLRKHIEGLEKPHIKKGNKNGDI